MRALRDLRIKIDDYIVRPASSIDPFSTIAAILYDAEPEVFSAWFNGERERGINVLTHLCSEPRSFFSFDHCIVIEHAKTHEITGVANIADARTRLDYDYSFLQCQDARADRVIDSYIYSWLDDIKSSDNTVLFMPSLCSTNGERLNRTSANRLMTALIRWSRSKDYNKIITKCPQGNKSSRNFYESHGFIRSTRETHRYVEDADPIIVSTFTHRNT